MKDNIKDFSDCDGKKCGQGKHVAAGNYICPHNNLEIKYPELISEWHVSNLLPMNSYLPGSGKKVLWKCINNTSCDCHVWESPVSIKTGNTKNKDKNGCPYCSNKKLCDHNNLEVMYPILKVEWDPNNKKSMKEYSYGSNEKVFWICVKNPCGCHKWPATITSRTNPDKPTGCPYCCNRKLCDHNNLESTHPMLKIEWDPNNKKSMKEYTHGSDEKVFWVCEKNPCGCHKWPASISSRTNPNKPTGCPYCCNQKLCEHNNLEAMFPELKIEWDPINKKQMKEYSCYSRDSVKWICQKNPCGCHKWQTEIGNRTNEKEPCGCPYCSKKKLCPHNNLYYEYPHLRIEWDPKNKKPMTDYSFGSKEKVNWVCSTNFNHIWDAVIGNRTNKNAPSGCPHCSKSKGYSNAQIKWLTIIEEKEKITIRHACKLNGEFKIQGIGKVDGFCSETNTIYEYHGDYWHGNPILYEPDNIHPTLKMTYGDLYIKTINRDNNIRNLGYNLIVMWESDFYQLSFQ